MTAITPVCPLAAVLAAAAAIAAPAIAQDAAPPLPPPDPAPRPTFFFRASEAYTFQADMEDAGSVAVARTGLGFGVDYDASDRLALGLHIDAEGSYYRFRGATGLVAGSSDPLSDAYSLTFRPRASLRFDDAWGAFLEGRLQFAGEPGADVGDAFLGGGLAAATYTFSPDFTLIFGVAGSTRLEDDPTIFPYLGVRWNINDRVRLTSEGVALILSADVSDDWTVTTRLAWEPREYRLDDDGPLPEGVIRDDRVVVGLGLEWRPAPAFELAIEGGGTVYQDFDAIDSGEEKAGDDNSDPAAFLGIRLVFRF